MQALWICLAIIGTTLLGALDNLIRYANIIKVEKEDGAHLDFSLASKIPIIKIHERKSVRARRKRKRHLDFIRVHILLQVIRQAIDPNMPYLFKTAKLSRSRTICLHDGIYTSTSHETRRVSDDVC